jgi:hypothetical protein
MKAALVVTLGLALSLAGFFSPSFEGPRAKACSCGQGAPSTGSHLPCVPGVDGCPVCCGPCLASLPESDRIGIVLRVIARTGEFEARAESLAYPPPLPPPRIPGPLPVTLT